MTKTAMKRVHSAKSATKYTCRDWQKAYFDARRNNMDHEAAVKAADASRQKAQA